MLVKELQAIKISYLIGGLNHLEIDVMFIAVGHEIHLDCIHWIFFISPLNWCLGRSHENYGQLLLWSCFRGTTRLTSSHRVCGNNVNIGSYMRQCCRGVSWLTNKLFWERLKVKSAKQHYMELKWDNGISYPIINQPSIPIKYSRGGRQPNSWIYISSYEQNSGTIYYQCSISMSGVFSRLKQRRVT